MNVSPDFRSRILPIVLAQGFGIMCGVVGVKLATTYVAPDDYGRFAVFGTLAPIGMAVVYAGLIKYVARYWAATDHEALRPILVRAALRRTVWLVLASVGATAVVYGHNWWRVAPFLLAAALALSIGSLAQTALQAERENWRDLRVTGVSSLLRSFTPTLFYIFAGGGMLALYGGFVFYAVGFAGAALWALGPKRAPNARGDPPAPSLVYAGPLFTLLAATDWIILGLNRWVVAFFFGATTAGFFSLATNLAVIIPSFLSAFVGQYFQPRLFARPHATLAERRALAAHVDRVAAMVAGSIIVGLLLLRVILPSLMGILIDPKYAAALDYLVPAGAFLAAGSTTSLFILMMQASQRESACGPIGLTHSAILALGCIVSAWASHEAFTLWLCCTPLVPWIVSRPLARHYLFKPSM